MKRWTPGEITTLRHEGSKPLRTLSVRLGRSYRAIQLKQRAGGALRRLIHGMAGDGMTRSGAASALGVPVAAVQSWLKYGVLPCDTFTWRGRRRYRIRTTHLQQFIREQATRRRMAPVGPWGALYRETLDLWHGQYISTADLANALGYTTRALRAYLEPRQGLPAPAVPSATSHTSWYDRAEIAAWLRDHPRYITAAARQEFGL